MTGRRVTEALAVAAGWALLSLAVLVCVEVVLRKFFAVSLKGVDEIGGYVLAIASAIGFVYALATHGHIRVDLMLRYAAPRLRAALHVLAHASLAAVAVLLAWRCAAVWLRSWSLDAVAATPLGTPLVWPQGVWVLGLVAFAALAVKAVIDISVVLARRGPNALEARLRDR